jgi:hypothetical protein
VGIRLGKADEVTIIRDWTGWYLRWIRQRKVDSSVVLAHHGVGEGLYITLVLKGRCHLFLIPCLHDFSAWGCWP